MTDAKYGEVLPPLNRFGDQDRRRAQRVGGGPQQAQRLMARLARPHARLALDTLVSIMEGSTSDPARVAAANSILDRAFGKAGQHLQVGVLGGDAEHFGADVVEDAQDQEMSQILSPEELREELARRGLPTSVLAKRP